MPQIDCPGCDRSRAYIDVQCNGSAELKGIINCLECGHEFPIILQNGVIKKLDTALPGIQSDKLNSSVPSDLKEDIQEAERAHYGQCFKACVAMCRRALQLALIEKGIGDTRLTPMLKEALTKKLLNDDTYTLSTTIKGYGDIGVHRKDKLDSEEVKMVIYSAVRMLNELFP